MGLMLQVCRLKQQLEITHNKELNQSGNNAAPTSYGPSAKSNPRYFFLPPETPSQRDIQRQSFNFDGV